MLLLVVEKGTRGSSGRFGENSEANAGGSGRE
jgi:hypothetical protein